MARRNRQLRERFGKALRARREAVRMTQIDLAVAAGLSEGYVSQLERGLRAPSLEAIAELAHALRVKGSDLLDDAGE